jgi:hypothetical protein
MKSKLVEEVGKVFKFEKQMFGIERFAGWSIGIGRGTIFVSGVVRRSGRNAAHFVFHASGNRIFRAF